MENVADTVAAFFLGAILLAPVAALSARFAMKPMIALLSRRLATDDLSAKVGEQGRRIELLESELAALHESTNALVAAADFEHRLATPNAKAGADSPIAR